MELHHGFPKTYLDRGSHSLRDYVKPLHPIQNSKHFSMKFSIIIPVYNAERYLEQCVSSVLRQSYDNFEIILIDDGSTDSSGSLCDAIATRDSRVRTIHQTNSGLSAARNAGIAQATGDYIFFLDSDDFWLSLEVLEHSLSILEKHPVDVIEFDAIKFMDGEEPTLRDDNHKGRPTLEFCLKGIDNKEDLFCHLIKHNAVVGSACNKIVSRRLFSNGDLRFREGVTAEDIDWTARLMSAAKTWLCYNSYFYAYRQRRGSISKSYTYSAAKQQISNVLYITRLDDKASYIDMYIAVCISNILINVAQLSFAEQRKLYPAIKILLPYRRQASAKRDVLIAKSISFFGYKFTLIMLRLAAKFTKQLDRYGLR